MTTDDTAASGVSPDEAFALVADETRLGILRTLNQADRPLAFSTLFERSEYDTRSNFSYHLDKLEGHFLSRTDGGTPSGRRAAGSSRRSSRERWPRTPSSSGRPPTRRARSARRRSR